MHGQTNRNLKEMSNRMKRRPRLADVAKYAKISRPQLANIIAGRRKASPETLQKIEEGFRRYLR